MRLRGWAWLALSSLLLDPLAGETRPHYGGTLTIEDTLSDVPGLGNSLVIPVAETLVRVNSRGQIEPVLSVAWQHDPDYKQWRFSLRAKVKFHDGQPLTAASVIPSLTLALKPDVSIEAGGQALVIKSAQPMPGLLEQLARVGISRAGRIGTGPFRFASDNVHRTTYTAFEDYWGGRPYLDSIIHQDASTSGRADIFDIPVAPQRRIVPEGWTTWSSAPKTLVAIQGLNVDANLLKALALAIDRAPIANVLAQHKGDAAFALLPQWLSGYEFLFQSGPDLARAKQIVAQLHPPPVSMEAPPNDPFLRSVAERIALNARDAGITIQMKPAGDLRLLELPLESTDVAYDLARIRAQLNVADLTQLDGATPEALYQFERSMIEEHHIIPLIHLRESYAISPKVHFQPSRDQFALHPEDAWIAP
jgi:peptide/nickel transport system substrate-binding protein